MEQDKRILLQRWIEKANEALSAAQDNIISDNLTTAQNRIYYSVFYSVMALAYFKDFHTSKHTELMGWFNKNFIKTEIFSKEMGTLYKNAFNDRNQADYTITFKPQVEGLKDLCCKAEAFIRQISLYINL